MGSKLQGRPEGFAAQLIAALEDAQAAAAQPKPPKQLAQSAWSKLQYDFPVVSAEELAALAQEYANGSRQVVSSRFLTVLRESAGVGPTEAPAASSNEASGGSTGSGNTSGSASSLLPLYQRLYAIAVLQILRSCLEAPEPVALRLLAHLQLSSRTSLLSAEGDSHLEQMLAAADDRAERPQLESEYRLSQQDDDDGTAYEPLEQPQPVRQLPPAVQLPDDMASSRPTSASSEALPLQLGELAGQLSYHCMSDAGAWRELQLMPRVAACLAALRRHKRFLELGECVAQPLLRLATDRMVAAPVELEAGLTAVLDALCVPGGGSTSTSGATSSGSGGVSGQADAAAGELALAAAVALAAQVAVPSARSRLWQKVQQRLLPLAGRQLEQQQVLMARQARASGTAAAAERAGAVKGEQASPEQLYRIALPCQLVYFYVLHAPTSAVVAPPGNSGSGGGASRVQEALLRCGLLRSLVLLFVQLAERPGAEPLRCALLLACAAAQPLVDWAVAVPGFSAAVAMPALKPGGEAHLHGALWQVLLERCGGQLAALLTDAQPAAKVPQVYQALQLMADMQAVYRGLQPLWDSGVDAALRELSATLRQHYSKPRQQQAEAAGSDTGTKDAGSDAGSDGAEEFDSRDARKLAVGPEEQAELLAARRAQQLQPACLKLVKDLLQRGGGGGKHD